MGLFGKSKSEKRIEELERRLLETEARAYSPASAGLLEWLGYGGMYGGVTSTPVTDDTILTISPAWAAIRYISEGVAALPLGVYGYDSQTDGYYERDEHPLNYLVSQRPHPYVSKFDFIQALVANACLGNGYARIHRDPAGAPYALEVIPSECVTLEYLPSGELIYSISGTLNGQVVNVRLLSVDMIHIKGVTFNGLQGKRVTLVHNENLSGARAANRYTSSFFENGAQVSGVVESPVGLTPAQVQRMQEMFDKKYSGADNAHKTPFLDGGAKYTKVGLNPQEAALIDFRRLSVLECSRIFKIPPHLLGDLTNANYSNIEQQGIDFRQHTLPPWTEKIEQEFSYKLFTGLEYRKRRAFVMFDYTYIQLGDMDSMGKFFASAIQNSVLTPNDARRMLKKGRVEGGDKTYIQQNMAPLDELEEILKGKQSGQDAATPNAQDAPSPTGEDMQDNSETPNDNGQPEQ